MAGEVKAALEAATQAVMDAMGWKDDGMQDFEPEPTARDAARDAIVAFLGALPDHLALLPDEISPFMAGMSGFKRLVLVVDRSVDE